MADADNFEPRPMDAAVMVVSYIHAKGLQYSETEYDEFLGKYSTIFEYPDENDAANEVRNYINELTEIVEKFISQSKSLSAISHLFINKKELSDLKI